MKKMSKSIKDYKDAMDSIKISDSFYKRTETLLSELSEAKIEKKPFYASKKITAGIMAAAAFIICIIGIRTVTDVRQGNIESTITADHAETTAALTEMTAPDLIDIFEDEEYEIDEMMIDDDIAIDDEVAEDEYAPAESVPSAMFIDEGGGITVATVPDTQDQIIPQSGEADQVTSSSGKITSSDKGKNESETDIIAGGGSQEAYAEGTDNIPLLKDISFEHVTVEITPYFNMENIISGESRIKKSGTECQQLIEFIGEISENSREISNYSFKSLFSMNITDENIGVTFYSIYVTELNTIVITKHSTDGQQRTTYGVSADKYNELKHELFLMFGTESDYELFENLVSGK